MLPQKRILRSCRGSGVEDQVKAIFSGGSCFPLFPFSLYVYKQKMSPFFPFILLLLPVLTIAQAPTDSTLWRLTGTRTEAWSSEEAKWLPTDSSALGYNSLDQHDTFEWWQYIGETWQLFRRSQFTYTSTGVEQETQEVTFTSEGEIQQQQRVLFTYNSQGQLSLVQRQIDNDGEWFTRVRVTYFYQEDGLLSVRNREVIDDSGILELDRNEYRYNPQGQRIEDRKRSLRGDSLVNEERSRFRYDGESRLDSLQEDAWSSNEWQPTGLSVFRYYRSDTLAVDTTILAQRINNEWRPLLRTLERVDPTEPRSSSEELQQFGGPGLWFGLQRNISTYDPALRQQVSRSQQYINDWENSSRTIRLYDPHDLLYLSTEESWSGQQWERRERTFRFYERYSTVTTSRPAAVLQRVRIFPNPARDWINIVLSPDEPTFTRVRVYDLQGRLYLIQDIYEEHNVLTFPPTLPSGTLVIDLQQGHQRGSWLIQRY